MKRLVCEMCGSNAMVKQDGFFVCQSCETKYSVEEARKMMLEGPIQVDSSHLTENYLEMARNAIDAGNNSEAELYSNKIVEVDPLNYEAWMIKGRAAGWQSTLSDSRISEAVSAFSKAIINAPDEKKKEMINNSKSEIVNLAQAMISLRGDRFAKWPDAEEASGFTSDISSIVNSVGRFITQTGVSIPTSDLLGPVATIINKSVVKAWSETIEPDYKGNGLDLPDRNDFYRIIDRIGYCTALVELAIKICDEDDEEDIQRYKNLIFLHKKALDSYGYDYEFWNYGSDNFQINNMINAIKRDGNIPDSRHDRYWFKVVGLTDAAISTRKQLIKKYEEKISSIESEKARKEAKEKAEKLRKEKEEAKKRFDDYWAEHADEKARLESEKKGLQEQIDALNASQNEQVAALNKEISAIPGQAEIDKLDERIVKLNNEKNSLGIFKGKEKKALQEQIDQVSADKKAVQDRMDAAKKEIEKRISFVNSEIQKKLSPLQSRVQSIDVELTKSR